MSKKPPTEEGLRSERPTITLTLPSGWGRAGAAGLLAAFLGWAIPVAVAMGSFWMVADSPWLRQTTWQNAAAAGSSFWALSLGSPAMLGELYVSAVPGLWSLIQLVALRLFLGRMRKFTPASVWAAVPTFTALSLMLVIPLADGVIWWHAAIGAVIISGLASLWAYWGAVRLPVTWADRLRPAAAGVLLGLAYLLAVNLIGFVAVVVRTFKQYDQVVAATQALQGPGAGGATLWILQLAFLPLACAWAAAWMTGSGFVGVGEELISPATPPTQGLPLPAWELIPTTDEPSTYWWVFVLVGFVFGALLWLLVRKRPPLFAVLVVLVGASAGILLLAAWLALADISMGTGALAHLGPDPWAATWSITIPLLLPASITPLVFHSWSVRTVTGLYREFSSGGTSDSDSAGAGLADTDSAGSVSDEADVDASNPEGTGDLSRAVEEADGAGTGSWPAQRDMMDGREIPEPREDEGDADSGTVPPPEQSSLEGTQEDGEDRDA